MTLTNEDLTQFLTGDRLPIWRETTRQLSVINPMSVESGIRDWSGRKVPGLPIGDCGEEGSAGTFYYDPFMLHKARKRLVNGLPSEPILPNLNGIVLGDVGMQKSGLVKDIVYMACAAGYSCLVTDLKGEYTWLVEAIEDAKELKIGQNRSGRNHFYVNPLDPMIPAEIQHELISSLAITVMGRNTPQLDIEERTLLREAIKAAKAEAENRHEPTQDEAGHLRPAHIPVLADLIDKLFQPTEEMARALREEVPTMQRVGRPIALALLELTEGNLKGMVDQPTSDGFFTDTPLLVLNLRGLEGVALAVMVIVLNYLTASQFGKASPLGRFRWIFHDETWKLAAFPGFAMSLSTAFKLGRSERVANWIIFHHLKDLWRSSQQEVVEGLFADAATKVLHHQDDQELRLAAGPLNLNDAILHRVPTLPAGSAIWMMGSEVIEVRHKITPEVLPLVDTSILDEALSETSW